MSELQIGDRVQWEEDGEFLGGVVHLVIPPAKKRDNTFYFISAEERAKMSPSVVVHWDDDTAESYNTYETCLTPEDNELEREFRIKATQVKKQIDQKLKEASDALQAATDLSEEHGIPFYASCSELGQSYYPDTFEEKYREIDSDFAAGITGASVNSDFRSGGWEHSAVCY